MRYLINRKTNEHERYDGQNYDATKYRIVEADSEGWIPHTGDVCPLPDDCTCEVTTLAGSGIIIKAGRMVWSGVVRYRPILAKKAQEPDYDPHCIGRRSHNESTSRHRSGTGGEMKTYYAVHNDKTHTLVKSPEDFASRFRTTHWTLVEADSEGWIPYAGTECPLPLDCIAEFLTIDGETYKQSAGSTVFGAKNGHLHITHYRPIIEPAKVQEPDPEDDRTCEERHAAANHKLMKQAEFSRLDVLGRLEMSYEYASKIPDLVEQLRDRLKPLGLGVMYLSEFDAMEPEAAVEQDMNDWRNWREGDLVQYTGQPHAGFSLYCLYGICELLSALCIYDDDGDDRPLESNAYRFRFHSRPAQQRHGAKGE